MEEFLPVIIAVAVLIYRVYTNFVKEQEKARKRNPAQRPDDYLQEREPVTTQPPVKYEYEPEYEWMEETYTPERPYEPQYKHVKAETPVKETYKEAKYERMVSETAVLSKYKEDTAQEVKLGRSIHAPHKHGLAVDQNEDEQERSAYADFDIHDAVIKSAILNRPEY